MEHALKALISANGQIYGRIHDIVNLTARAMEADPGFRFEPAVEGRIYNQYAGSNEYYDPQERITDIPGYQELVRYDVQAVLDRVQNVREARSR